MFRSVSAQTSFLEAGEPYAVEFEPDTFVFKVDVVGNLRTYGNAVIPVPRLVRYYFASDAEGVNPVDGPGGTSAVLEVLAPSGTWNITIENLFVDPYVAYLVAIVDDGVFSVPLSIPGAIIP